jgi:hypothetical protein
VVHTLYTKDIGVKLRDMDDLVHLAGSRLDGADDSTLMNIVASKEGLFGRGLVDCKSFEGNGTGIVDVRNIELTQAGQEYVTKNLPKTKMRACIGWLANNILGAAISTATGIVIGWWLRAIIRP